MTQAATARLQEEKPIVRLFDEVTLYRGEDLVGSLDLPPEAAAALEERIRIAAWLHGSFFARSETGSVRAALKCYRGVVLLFADGRVRSSEHLKFDDLEGFFLGPKASAFHHLASLSSFDDAATLFTDAAMDLRLVQNNTWLSGKDETPRASVEAELRFVEYFLNRDARQGRFDPEDLLEEEVAREDAPEGTKEADFVCPLPELRHLRVDIRRALEKRLLEHRLREHADAVAAFRAHLDGHHVLPTMRAAGLNGCRWYNWLVGQSRMGGLDYEAGKKRLEALQVFPLIHCLASEYDNPVSQAIEQGDKLQDALAGFFNCDKARVKALRFIDTDAVSLQAAPDQQRLAAIINNLKYAAGMKKPANSAEWKSFFAALKASQTISAYLQRDEEDISGMLRSLSGNWSAVNAEAMEFVAAAFPDMVRDLMDTLIHPALCYHHTEELPAPSLVRIADLLAGERPFLELVTLVLDWAENNALIKASLEANFPLLEYHRKDVWPALHQAPVRMSNGLTVHSLASVVALHEERERLKHCVDTYVAACLYRGCHLVSVRSPDGSRSLSTAQLEHDWLMEAAGSKVALDHLDFDHLPEGVVQHRGFKNTTPPLLAKQALAEYVSKLVSGAISVDKDTLQESLEYRRSSSANKDNFTFDATNPAAIMQAWDAYKEYFPRKLRRMTIKNFVKVACTESDGT